MTKETSKSTLRISIIGTKDILLNILKYSDITSNLYQGVGYAPETFCFSIAIEKSYKFLNYIYNNSTIYLDRKYFL